RCPYRPDASRRGQAARFLRRGLSRLLLRHGSSRRPRSRQNGRMVTMSREDFESAVADALDMVPPELARLVENVVVLVEDEPPPEEEPDLLGLYDGVALTERGNEWGFGELPD